MQVITQVWAALARFASSLNRLADVADAVVDHVESKLPQVEHVEDKPAPKLYAQGGCECGRSM